MPDPMGGLPLPATAGLAFWRGEVERAVAQLDTHKTEREENLQYYTGKPLAKPPTTDYVNVNVDFYEVEQKAAELFYETPELQLSAKPPMEGQDPILHAFRAILNELLGPDHADVLVTVEKATLNCLCVAGDGPTIIGYEPTLKTVTPPPPAPGAVLGLTAQPVQVPIDERWYWDSFSSAKFLRPADFTDTDWDKAPWLGMKFRMPLTVAKGQFKLPDTFTGAATRDEAVYRSSASDEAAAETPMVDGTVVWYRAAFFDPEAKHPQLYRELVLIEGLDAEARHRDSPHQTIGPNGRLTADSMIGNPIHPLNLRYVPDAAFVPSDTSMTRGLVKEKCLFRTQMVKERDANRARFLYDNDILVPEIIAKIQSGETGDLIGVPGGSLTQGVNALMAQVGQSQPSRQTYLAEDYITRDIEKTLGMTANRAGVKDDKERSATEVAITDRQSSTRQAKEQARLLRWYLKGVSKYAALVIRYLTQDLAVQMVGQEQASLFLSWQQAIKAGQANPRLSFTAKPDSQIRIDAAQKRKEDLNLYQMTAKDPNVIRVQLLKELFTDVGKDPTKLVVEKLPEKAPEPNVSFRFSGEDLIGPQAPIVREIMAQGGIQISQQAISESAGQLFKQLTLGIRDADGKAVPATPRPQEHGGPADQVRPLSKQSGDTAPRQPMGAVA